MPRSSLSRPLVLVATMALLVAPMPSVSDPVGIYALIDRVTLEPDDQNPRAVRISGVFALSDGQPGDEYRPPERGYLYYRINPRNERASLAEWSDLRTVAGTGQPVGFGGRFEPLGRVRPESEAAASPDTYPIGFGLVRLGSNPESYRNGYGLVRQLNGTTVERELRAVPAPHAPADGGSVRPGPVRLVARNVSLTGVQYQFEIASGSEREASPPIAAGNGETAWSPALRVRAGQRYTWRVWVTNGNWRGQPAGASFRAGE